METVCTGLLKNEFITIVSTIAVELGIQVYLVGGSVRDVLMSRKMKDFDFVLSDKPEELPVTFARQIGGSFFWLDKQRLQSRVVKKHDGGYLTFDFAVQQGGDICQDLSLRDFTINALAVPLGSEQQAIVDPLFGISDLRKGVVRACTGCVFDNDPLRLLRALRFSAVLEFSIAPDTWRLIHDKAPLIRNVAPERIRDELFRILETPDSGSVLAKLYEAGLLGEILPFLCVPADDGSNTVGRSTAGVSVVERTIAELHSLHRDFSIKMLDYLAHEVEAGVAIGSLVKLAVLVGNDQMHLQNAVSAAEKLRLGCTASRILEILVGQLDAVLAVSQRRLTDRVLFRFFKDRDPAGLAVLVLALSRKLLPTELYFRLAGYYFDEYPGVQGDNLLSGEEIMNILGTGPGKPVGKAGECLRQAERQGLVSNKEEARAYLKNLLTKDEAVI